MIYGCSVDLISVDFFEKISLCSTFSKPLTMIPDRRDCEVNAIDKLPHNTTVVSGLICRVKPVRFRVDMVLRWISAAGSDIISERIDLIFL